MLHLPCADREDPGLSINCRHLGFNQQNKGKQLEVPIVSWRRKDQAVVKGGEELLQLLVDRSPFTREWITGEFHRFEQGTRICLFGLSNRDDPSRTPDLDMVRDCTCLCAATPAAATQLL